MTIKTNADYQETFRAKMKAQGLKEVRGIYLPPDKHTEVKVFARRILKKARP